MNSRIWTQSLVFVGLVALGIATRMVPYWTPLQSWNLNAVAAIALFAGFYFRNPVIATLAAALPLVVGDALIQQYDASMMVIVYVAQLLPVVVGPWLRQDLGPLRVGIAALGASVFFFVVSNSAYWFFYKPLTVAELVKTFVDAVPFYRGTLIGNLVFATVLFGLYGIVTSMGRIAEHEPQTKPVAS